MPEPTPGATGINKGPNRMAAATVALKNLSAHVGQRRFAMETGLSGMLVMSLFSTVRVKEG
jgi:hypothetical protein